MGEERGHGAKGEGREGGLIAPSRMTLKQQGFGGSLRDEGLSVNIS